MRPQFVAPTAFWKSAVDTFRRDAAVYGLPQTGHFGGVVMYVNRSLLKKAGVAGPPADGNWTVDDLINQAKAVTRPNENEWGWQPNLLAMVTHVTPVLRAFGGDFVSADGKRCLLDSPDSVAALQWLYDSRFRHQVAPLLAREPIPARAFIADGRLAFTNETPATLGRLPTQVGSRFEWDATMFPKGPKGLRGSQVEASGFGITASSKHPEAAWEWLKYVVSKDYSVESTLGGFSSPNARNDVWTDSRLVARHPAYGALVRAVGEPRPYNDAANDRGTELEAAVIKELDPLWAGEAAPAEAARRAAEAGNRILALPSSGK